MELRTYYWTGRVVSKWKHFRKKVRRKNPSGFFTVGNCGDIFNQDLMRHLYGQEIRLNNATEGGRRLILVGSTSHNLQRGDILCGVGTKHEEVPVNVQDVSLKGLRGPLTYEIFRRAGYDVSEVSFLYDPGLLIAEMVPQRLADTAKPNGAIFIPHYRERFSLPSLPNGIRFCDIDCRPVELAEQILDAELVYASSLHGIIFAHSLGRPAVFVRPKTHEPELKFRDYYASVGLPFPSPLSSIDDASFVRDGRIAFDISFKREQMCFPTIEGLIAAGAASI